MRLCAVTDACSVSSQWSAPCWSPWPPAPPRPTATSETATPRARSGSSSTLSSRSTSGTSRSAPPSSRAASSAGSADALSGRSGRAPVGVTASGTWWQAPQDQFSPGNLWFFDPVGEARPYGYRSGYQPTGTITPYSQQFAFTYAQNGDQLALSFPTGTRQSISVVGYDAGNDVLTVVYEGYRQRWVGCRSDLMPAVALAACR